jgi:hypothetical protein
VESARIYRVNDPDFPEARTEPGQRPVKFDVDDIERYARIRETRNAGGRGCPPATVTAGIDPQGSGDLASRIRAAVRTKRHDITTLRELADRLEISSTALGRKLKGEFRWKQSELELIHRVFGIDVSTGNVQPSRPGGDES